MATAKATKPYVSQHRCPNCSNVYTIGMLPTAMYLFEIELKIFGTFEASINPEAVPDDLRPHLYPSIRPLHLDPSSSGTIATDSVPRHKAEAILLRAQRDELQRRLNASTAATVGISHLARLARDYGLRMKIERDTLQRKYHSLKRRVTEEGES